VTKTKSRDRTNAFLDDPPLPEGFHFIRGYFDEARQRAIAVEVRDLLDVAPLFQQRMPRTGAPLSVKMSNAGDYGWVTDQDRGYRYQATHPETGEHWPPIPKDLLNIWADTTAEQQPPNLCLINYYDAAARLGLHQDRGDSSLDAPVVSISLGDDAIFVLGGTTRKASLRRFDLRSGDLIWFGGPSRLVFHGVEHIRLGTSTLLDAVGVAKSGRINVTLRRIDRG
jgi:DNA oxidative demethylase